MVIIGPRAKTYQGAKNLMNTVFPAVSTSKLAGVRLTTPADAAVRRESTVVIVSFMVAMCCSVVLCSVLGV